jgi:hypothetical protein
VCTGLKSNWLLGGIVGGVAGFTIGYVGTMATTEETSGGVLFTREEGAGMTGSMVGLLGFGIGALIGAFVKTDRWEATPLDRLRVSFAPQRDGRFALGLSISF